MLVVRSSIFLYDKFVRGSVEEIKEVYLEKENLGAIKDKEIIKGIIGYAEQLSCALIYEDVYGLIE